MGVKNVSPIFLQEHARLLFSHRRRTAGRRCYLGRWGSLARPGDPAPHWRDPPTRPGSLRARVPACGLRRGKATPYPQQAP
eukprot:2650451-Amphidinium_carterae.1